MKKASVVIVTILVAIGLSSCKLFRKKNKCDTCPSWKTQLEQFEEGNI